MYILQSLYRNKMFDQVHEISISTTYAKFKGQEKKKKKKIQFFFVPSNCIVNAPLSNLNYS